MELHITDSPEIKGWSATIEYDPTQVAYESGSFEAGEFLSGIISLANEKDSSTDVGGVVLGTNVTASGNGYLGKMAFRVLDGFTGSTEISISKVSLNRADIGEELILVDYVVIISSEAAQGLPGDFSGDGIVDFSDFFSFADAFGGSSPVHDLNSDGTVDFSDFFVFADNFGKKERAKLLVMAQEMLGLPQAASLGQNYPNPFNPTTTIEYRVRDAGPVTLVVFDLAGQIVRHLETGFMPPGFHTAHWNGRDNSGLKVASGIYLYELRAGDFRYYRKMSFIK
jgi:hypothetical protein